MAEDMAPALIEAVRAEFTRLMGEDDELAEKLAKIQAGSVSYTDALDYADRVGHALAQALGEELTADTLPAGTLYYNIAQRLITEVGGEACTQAAVAALSVQQAVNEAAGLGLTPVKAQTTSERLTGLINTVSGNLITDTASTLAAGARALPQGVVSDTMEANAQFQGESGLTPKIVRKSAYRCCEWCSRMAGTYTYPVADRNIYRRHKNCRCTVEYVVGKKRTNVHTKRVTTAAKQDTIEARKQAEKAAEQREAVRKLMKIPNVEQVHIPAKKIETESLGFDAEHLLLRGRSITKEEAVQWIQNAKVSIDVWNGSYTRYFSDEGAAYVNNAGHYIRTAYRADKFTENIKRAMEVLKDG